MALVLNGRYGEAAGCFDQSATSLVSTPDFNRLGLYICLTGLGWVFYLEREYSKAIDCFEEALRDREVAFGLDDCEGIQ